MWLSLRLIVYKHDEEEGKQLALMSAKAENENLFPHLSWQVGIIQVIGNRLICVDLLQKNYGYLMKKVKGLPHKWNERIEVLLNDFNDYAFSVLKDSCLDTHHSVTIYRVNKLIYYHAEKIALKLSKENLKKCVGEPLNCRSFESMYTMFK